MSSFSSRIIYLSFVVYYIFLNNLISQNVDITGTETITGQLDVDGVRIKDNTITTKEELKPIRRTIHIKEDKNNLSQYKYFKSEYMVSSIYYPKSD